MPPAVRTHCQDCGDQLVAPHPRRVVCPSCRAARKLAADRQYSEANRERKRLKAAEWLASNRERNAASCKARRDANLEEVRARDRARYRANPERKKKAAVAHYAAHRTDVLKRMASDEGRARARARYAKLRQDPTYRLYTNVSRHMRVALHTGKGGRRWEALVGYTVAELASHLERQFLPGMTWENMGRRWHIDHIRPRASFVFVGPDCPEFRECYALTNLRPLWAKENISKSAKRLYLI